MVKTTQHTSVTNPSFQSGGRFEKRRQDKKKKREKRRREGRKRNRREEKEKRREEKEKRREKRKKRREEKEKEKRENKKKLFLRASAQRGGRVRPKMAIFFISFY